LRRLDELRRRKTLCIFKQINFDVGVKTFFQAEWAAKAMGDMGNRKSKGISAVGDSRQVNLNKVPVVSRNQIRIGSGLDQD
jgi:hypothetical protein